MMQTHFAPNPSGFLGLAVGVNLQTPPSDHAEGDVAAGCLSFNLILV